MATAQYRSTATGGLIEIATGKVLTLKAIELGNHGHGKQNMVVGTAEDGTKMRIARTVIDETEYKFGPGAMDRSHERPRKETATPKKPTDRPARAEQSRAHHIFNRHLSIPIGRRGGPRDQGGIDASDCHRRATNGALRP